MNESKVYIVNFAGHNFDAAERYGKLTPVTRGNINIYRVDRDLFTVGENLKDFDHKEDYLLLSGNVLVNAMAIAVLMAKRIPKLNLLVYDAKNMEYISHVLAIDKAKKEVKFERKKGQTVNN